jgi:hypothetical protein
MADIFDITRREFIRNSALLTAGTAFAHAAELTQEAAAAQRTTAPVFPYGAVYFRKTNPPPEDRDEYFPPLVHVVRD